MSEETTSAAGMGLGEWIEDIEQDANDRILGKYFNRHVSIKPELVLAMTAVIGAAERRRQDDEQLFRSPLVKREMHAALSALHDHLRGRHSDERSANDG